LEATRKFQIESGATLIPLLIDAGSKLNDDKFGAMQQYLSKLQGISS
jgi:hypothetical protein